MLFCGFLKICGRTCKKKSSSLQIASKLKPPTGFLISEICQLLTTGNSPRNPSICHQPLPAVSRRGLEVLDLSTVKKKMTTHNHRWNSFSSKPLIFVSSSLRTCSEGCRCHRKHAPDVYACANRYINHMYIQTQAEKMHRNGAEIFKSKFN